MSALFEDSYVKWTDQQDVKLDGVVVSSRVRLARNLVNMPFPHMLNNETGENCLKLIQEAQKDSATDLADYQYYRMQDLSPLDRMILMEKHLLSPQFVEHVSPWQAFLSNENGSLSVMVNEEDHIRLQCLLPGLQLQTCFEMVNSLDDQMEEKLDYAFDERLGYLTACPTNVGTGIRASVMLHLPAIQQAGQINYVIKNVTQVGMAVRGLYGEGSEALGNLFQISNQVTLGQSEEDIYHYLHVLTLQLVEQEKNLRQSLYHQRKNELCNQIMRAYGLLKYAHMMDAKEALSLLSDLRLGVDLGIMPDVPADRISDLIVAIGAAHLQKQSSAAAGSNIQDILRAKIIRERLSPYEEGGI